jgi:hypothetical protein
LLSLSSAQVDNNIRVAWTYPTQPTAHTYKLQLLRTGPISLGKMPDKHHASILTHEVLNSSPYDDPLTIDGRYGYWGRVIDADTGETTPFLSCSTDFVFAAMAPVADVTGYLEDAVAHIPIAGVTVECATLEAQSGLDGIFTILDVPSGPQTVTPDPTFYTWNPTHKDVTVPAGGILDVGTFLGELP